jgi:hypothetical protein
MTKAVDGGASVTLTERLSTARDGLRIHYLGAPDVFVIEDLTIGRTSRFAGPGSIAAETLSIDWPHRVPAGTEIACRVRSTGRTSATFVAVVSGP